jgi:NADPH2:quinone reductase
MKDHQMAKTAIIEAHGGPEQFRIVDRDVGAPGAGEIRIAHKAIGLNFIDVYQRTGLYPMELPHALGMEAAGIVEAVWPLVIARPMPPCPPVPIPRRG